MYGRFTGDGSGMLSPVNAQGSRPPASGLKLGNIGLSSAPKPGSAVQASTSVLQGVPMSAELSAAKGPKKSSAFGLSLSSSQAQAPAPVVPAAVPADSNMDDMFNFDQLDAALSAGNTTSSEAVDYWMNDIDQVEYEDEDEDDDYDCTQPQVDPTEATQGSAEFDMFDDEAEFALVNDSLAGIGSSTTSRAAQRAPDLEVPLSLETMGVSMAEVMAQKDAQKSAQQQQEKKVAVSMFGNDAIGWNGEVGKAPPIADDILDDFFNEPVQHDTISWDLDMPAPDPVPVVAAAPEAAAPPEPAAAPNKAPSLRAKKGAKRADTAAAAPEVRTLSISSDCQHVGVHCNMCKATPIVGPRYKCLNCADFDLCFKCVTTTNSHPPKHIFLEIMKPCPKLAAIRPRPCIATDVDNSRRGWHPSIQCQDCGEKPITGPRYKCIVCDKYDICKKCAATRREQIMSGKPDECSHQQAHVFARIRCAWMRSQCSLWGYSPVAVQVSVEESMRALGGSTGKPTSGPQPGKRAPAAKVGQRAVHPASSRNARPQPGQPGWTPKSPKRKGANKAPSKRLWG